MKLPQRILIATDLSDASHEAIDAGAALADAFDAETLMVTVLDPMPYVAAVDLEGGSEVWNQFLDDAEASLRRQLQELRDQKLGREKCELVVLRESAAGRAIAEYAKERGADLIVVGSHGRTGVKRVLLGSVAEKVVRLAECAVFVAR